MDLRSHDSQPERSTITQPATVSCLSQKPVMKCSNRQRLGEVVYLQVGCLCSRKSLQGKQNLAETYCVDLPVTWSTASAASSTFIHIFYYDSMHSLIPSTSVTSSEENLLLTRQLFSVQFLLSHFAGCRFIFYFLKIINFVSENWNDKMSESGQLMLWHDFPLQKPAGELFAFTSKVSCQLLLTQLVL